MTGTFILCARGAAAPAGFRDRALYVGTDRDLVEAWLAEGRFASGLEPGASFVLLQAEPDRMPGQPGAQPVPVAAYGRDGTPLPGWLQRPMTALEAAA